MLQVKVSTGKGMAKLEGIVNIYGFNNLTPRAARAALQIAGYNTGEAWTMTYDKNGPDYASDYGYRVYSKSARKIYAH